MILLIDFFNFANQVLLCFVAYRAKKFFTIRLFNVYRNSFVTNIISPI
ncbi:hypothetical protein LDG_8339 [Legionella drancourtii LLAP12]|uniref:Uncharacterized protein n=1 Tax=Legionella drancourtii LLAP12 TaxID=658187 RepID=G9ESK3_9GAMM|nr:hypothetical protein LDG_8339 [Legionella drancourtii LLAP12]